MSSVNKIRGWLQLVYDFVIQKMDTFCNLNRIDLDTATLWTDKKMITISLSANDHPPKKAWWKFWLLSFLVLSAFSCGKLRQKRDDILKETKQTVNEARKQISEQKNRLADRILPGYDSNQPSTENNKKRFKEHLQVALSEDVKNIFAYGDFLGVDYKVLISFTCDSSTIHKIISVKKMEPADKYDQGLVFTDELSWWDKNKIQSLTPFKTGKAGEHWEYLWYDPKTKQAFYEEFSM